jgi:glucan 1,3-beta-glucosidase
MISSPIVDYYYTVIIGNPNDLPTIKATSGFSGGYLIDADPYYTSNPNWAYTDVFYRQIRNFVIDTTNIPAGTTVSAIHWPTAQATSLQNIVFLMSTTPGNQHQGLFIESGM